MHLHSPAGQLPTAKKFNGIVYIETKPIYIRTYALSVFVTKCILQFLLTKNTSWKWY